jgi:hypothetical protein
VKVFQIKPKKTVYEMKVLLGGNVGIIYKNINLFYDKKQLKDGQTLLDCGVKDQNTILFAINFENSI